MSCPNCAGDGDPDDPEDVVTDPRFCSCRFVPAWHASLDPGEAESRRHRGLLAAEREAAALLLELADD